jgi:hypothetical protein
MKKICFYILAIILCNSCKNTWSQEDKDAFYQACTEEAQKTGDTPEKAKAYCDCVFGKMEKKYPNEEDALEHIDILAKDTELIKCKEEVMNATPGNR